MTPRAKWQAFLHGEDVGPMVAPLVDDWSLDMPYYWPYEEPDPYPPGHPQHGFSQQMAMAAICGYDPLYYVGPPFVQIDPVEPIVTEYEEGGKTHIETRTATPYGELRSVVKMDKIPYTVKPEIETEDDYRKSLWLIEKSGQIDAEESIRRGKELLAPMGEKGVVGTWWGAPGVRGVTREDLFCHLVDFPELFRESIEAQFAVDFNKLEILRAMGFDYLFYCVDGTEWISPDYFAEFVAPYTERTFARWRELGGFIVWHSCGHITRFVELGYYNRFLPEIFETMSQPPFGVLPSLRWGRERLDPRIATKGNIDLQLIHDGPVEAIRDEVRRVKAETAGWRHIIGASDDILTGTPLAHMRAFVEEARKMISIESIESIESDVMD